MESAKCCRTRKNNQILQKLQENEENLAIFTVILMAAFGTKNVHSAHCGYTSSVPRRLTVKSASMPALLFSIQV